ncbi:twin-arginine translocase subunit TatC [Desulforhopalus vacuolatus]|uniref:twin-arginine translocase subunit TatC n=1 Tax=Desulforhopalus vacuolatus TaxID=40414 RepID=UPI001963AEC5|nr:twin-arginine translocase subunit TatC [Desulforhopalus vacuolatus]MBM9520435.1 twin-arginine translocase subunit TatC [Desulforhopalus vacuolatus]
MTTETVHPLLHSFIQALSGARRAIRNFLLTFGLLALGIFLLSPGILEAVQRHLGGTLYFFSVAGPFLAHAKLALFAAFFLLAPWFMALFWRLLGKTFKMEKRQLRSFLFCTCFLFYSGALFCYFITLPFGIQFLLGFGSEELKPVISVGRCINFVTLFLLGFAGVFELPVFMVFLVRVKIFTLDFYRKNRRYAVLAIAILAAMLTPTPDVVNMALMGGPLYLLYEAGIAATVLLQKKMVNTPPA